LAFVFCIHKSIATLNNMVHSLDRPQGDPSKPRNAELGLMPKSLLSLFAVPTLARLTNFFPRWLDSRIDSDSGFTGPRVMVMWLLSRWHEPTMGQVAEMLDLTPRAITRLTDGLETEGYVERIENADDGRVYNICLTPKGERAIKVIESELTPEFVSLFSCLTAQEIRAFIKTAEKLTDHMKALH